MGMPRKMCFFYVNTILTNNGLIFIFVNRIHDLNLHSIKKMTSNCFNLLKKPWLMQLVIVFLVFLFSCSKNAEPPTPLVIIPPLTGTPQITITTLLTNQGIIWGFDVLPNGNLLFTQKVGTMQLFDTSTRSNTIITGLPANISATGQGGLLDVALSPDYATTRSVFVTYSIIGGFLSLAKFTLNGNAATNW